MSLTMNAPKIVLQWKNKDVNNPKYHIVIYLVNFVNRIGMHLSENCILGETCLDLT